LAVLDAGQAAEVGRQERLHPGKQAFFRAALRVLSAVRSQMMLLEPQRRSNLLSTRLKQRPHTVPLSMKGKQL
jgi:hypothetical protein